MRLAWTSTRATATCGAREVLVEAENRAEEEEGGDLSEDGMEEGEEGTAGIVEEEEDGLLPIEREEEAVRLKMLSQLERPVGT